MYNIGNFFSTVVPVASMLKRREIDVEIEYYSANKGKATKRIRGFGKQISLPNGFMIPSCKSKIQRTKSTPGVLDSSDVQGMSFKLYYYHMID